MLVEDQVRGEDIRDHRSRNQMRRSAERAGAARAVQQILSRAAPGRVVYIIMLQADVTGSGVGSELLHRALTRATAAGATVAFAVSANFTDRSPLPFWLARGFEILATDPDVTPEDYALIGKVLVST